MVGDDDEGTDNDDDRGSDNDDDKGSDNDNSDHWSSSGYYDDTSGDDDNIDTAMWTLHNYL